MDNFAHLSRQPLRDSDCNESNADHQSLRVTPAMEAGISDNVWSLEESIDLLK